MKKCFNHKRTTPQRVFENYSNSFSKLLPKEFLRQLAFPCKVQAEHVSFVPKFHKFSWDIDKIYSSHSGNISMTHLHSHIIK